MTPTDTEANGSGRPSPEGSGSRFAPPPADVPAPSTARSRTALAIVLSIGLVGVFFAAFLVGHDAATTPLPARKTSAAAPTTTPSAGTSIPGTGASPTTGFTPSTGVTPSTGTTSGDLFFILSKAELVDPQGCNANVTFTFTFDPAKMPDAGTDAVILVTGPNSSDTYHATPAFGAVKVTVPVSLDVPGMWTGAVQSIGGKPAWPQEASITLSGTCF